MKKVIAALALLTSLSTLASQPVPVRIDVLGQFDANLILTGVFTASGGLSTQGTLMDSPMFLGAAIHVTRTMITSDNESILFEIHSNSESGGNVVPTWCAPPTLIPAGMVLRPRSGNWRIVSGSGKYALLNGTGSWATWVTFDPALGLPVASTECMAGTVRN